MKINTDDKKTIKNYITTYLSFQGIIAIVIVTIIAVFGMKIIKTVNQRFADSNARFSHSSDK